MGPYVIIEAQAWRSGVLGHDNCCSGFINLRPQGGPVESAKKASVLQTASTLPRPDFFGRSCQQRARIAPAS